MGSMRPEELVREVRDCAAPGSMTRPMSALTDHPNRAVTPPTPGAPEYGEIRLRNLPLSSVAYWQEGDLHVFRSTEYDVVAADEDIDAAARIFAEKSEDYAAFIADPERGAEPSRISGWPFSSTRDSLTHTISRRRCRT